MVDRKCGLSTTSRSLSRYRISISKGTRGSGAGSRYMNTQSSGTNGVEAPITMPSPSTTSPAATFSRTRTASPANRSTR
jgi:hypothetical protein